MEKIFFINIKIFDNSSKIFEVHGQEALHDDEGHLEVLEHPHHDVVLLNVLLGGLKRRLAAQGATLLGVPAEEGDLGVHSEDARHTLEYDKYDDDPPEELVFMLEQAGVLALGVVQQHAVVDVVRHLVSSAAETTVSYYDRWST